MPEDISKTLLQFFPEAAFLRSSGLSVANASERHQHGEEAESVEKEISGLAEERHGKTAQRGAKNARHVELRRVERNSIGEIFSRNKLRHQGLIRRSIERHGDAGAQRQQHNLCD